MLLKSKLLRSGGVGLGTRDAKTGNGRTHKTASRGALVMENYPSKSFLLSPLLVTVPGVGLSSTGAGEITAPSVYVIVS